MKHSSIALETSKDIARLANMAIYDISDDAYADDIQVALNKVNANWVSIVKALIDEFAPQWETTLAMGGPEALSPAVRRAVEMLDI